MKNWLVQKWLPLWAKESVLLDNRQLKAENLRLRQANAELTAYIEGLHYALKATKRMKIYGGEKQ